MGYTGGYAEQAQLNFIDQQQQLLQQAENLNNQYHYQQQFTQGELQKPAESQNHFTRMERQMFPQGSPSKDSENCDETGASSLPCQYAENYVSMAIPATLNEPSESASLILVSVPFVLGGVGSETVSLVDGGSTHSFLSPHALSEAQQAIFDELKITMPRRLFNITGATGTVQEFCYLVDLEIAIGNWSGSVQFVLSSRVNKHKMVLGRDFLKKRKVVVDHGTDELVVEGVRINSIHVEKLK